MIAAPLPLLWRKQEMVAALSPRRRQGHRHIGAHRRERARPRSPCRWRPSCFRSGTSAASGAICPMAWCRSTMCSRPARSNSFSRRRGRATPPPMSPPSPSMSPAMASLPVARSHSELIAGGLAAFLEGGIAQDATILSAIPLGSFAGIALSVMPWLLSGGTLALHHGFDPAVFAEQCRAHDAATVVLPGPALTPLADAGLLGGQIKTILALWRAPEQLAAAAPWQGDAALVDIASFGEIGLLPARRGPDGMPAPIPHGAIAAPRGAAGAVAASRPCAPGRHAGAARSDGAGARLSARRRARPRAASDARTASSTPALPAASSATPARLPSPVRPPASPRSAAIASGSARSMPWWRASIPPPSSSRCPTPCSVSAWPAARATRAATAAELQARGVNSLIAGAFRPRGKANAA